MAVQFKDYYDLLGVPKTASEDEIRQAFRKLARKHHPDVNPGDKSAEERFKDLNEAYEVLSDPQKRKRYDQLGPNWKAGADFTPPPGWQPAGGDGGRYADAFGGAGAGDFSDFFESLFGRRRAPGGGFRTRGQSVEAELTLTLEEAHRGGTRRIQIEALETCAECNGTGAKNGKPCPVCRGAGLVRRPKTVDVTIPKGTHEGTVIRLAGYGEPGSGGGQPGDLLLHVHLRPHGLFELVGEYDTQLELPVAPWEAALGAKVAVPTLDGSVEMTIPANSQAGQRMRLRGQGLNRRTGERGDQFVKLKLVNPPKVTAKEKEFYEKLASESHFDARQLLARF